MNDLLKMRFFSQLTESSQEVTNNEMQNSYDELIEQVGTMSNGSDYSNTYRILAVTRIELASLGASPLYGQGEKCA